MTKSVHEHLNDDALPMCLVALENGEPIGMVRLIEVWTKDPEVSPWIAAHPEAFPWVCGLIVAESHRRKGLGTKLLEAVKKKALEMGKTALYLGANNNAPYRALYEKHGYVEIAQTTFRDNPMTVMQYTLPE